MKSGFLNGLKFLLGWPLSIIALYWIWIYVSPQAYQLISIFKDINITFLTLGIVCYLIYYFVRGYMWHRLLKGHAYNISFKDVNFYWAISEVKRYIPGKFWFVLGRALAFSDLGVEKKVTGKLLVIELELFALGSLIVSLLALPFLLNYFLTGTLFLQFLPAGASLMVLSVILIYIFNQKLMVKIPNKFNKFLGAVLPTNKPEVITLLLFLSVISLLFYGAANYLTIISITYINPQLFPQLIGFFTFSFFIGFISFLTPAGLGIREGVVAYGLMKIMSSGIAAFASIFARILLVMSEIIYILISFLWMKIKRG